MDTDLQNHFMNLCNCSNITILGISFTCVNDSTATYSFLVTGEDALEAATVFNYSLANQDYITTDGGISFSLHNSVKNTTDTMQPTFTENNNDDMINSNIFIALIVLIAVIAAVGLVFILAM